MTWIKRNTKKAAILLAPEFKLTPEKTYQYMTWPGMDYTTRAPGLMGFAVFMKQAGYIKKIPTDVKEIAWNNVKF
jgi:NitT/TauT family transport system substrate-binding protein